MKTRLLSLLLVMLTSVMPMKLLAADGNAEPYAVLSDNDTKLTFYYDDQREARGGMSVAGSFGYPDYQPWHSQAESITSAEFDPSFANCTTLTSTAFWFYGCKNMGAIFGIQYLKTDNVTSMSSMFDGCSGLTSLDVSHFNTANVKYMNVMFSGCSGLTSLDVSGFKTENVMDMWSMFYGCSGLTSLDVSGFKTDNVTAMSFMFYKCSALTSLDVSGFKTDNVTDMVGMFSGCSALTSLDVSGFNTANVADMSGMFFGCSGLTSLELSNFNTANVTDMAEMFWGCSGLTSLDVSGFNTANVTDMSYMFIDCSGLTSLDVSGFNTANVTDMVGMFSGCKSLTSLDISNLNTANVKSMHRMFDGCSGLTSLDVSNFNTSNVTDMSWMFAASLGLTNLDVSGFKTDNVTDMNLMFYDCSGLTNLDVSGFNTASVTNMKWMFNGCSGLTSLDVSGFNTANVADMSGMFWGCYGLTSLELSNFNTANVTDMSLMFYDCSGLTSLDIRNFDMSKVNNEEGNMFAGCFSLASIIAGNANIPAEEYANVTNPNLLVYVNDASLAPSNVQNVVINGMARDIVLTDTQDGNNDWYAPQAFVAERISYSRLFSQTTQKGVSRGWESIALPFDVQTIQHETKGAIAPFYNQASNRHFWLRRLTENGLQAATGIEANIPYIISMPNSEEYTDDYNLNGRVTFSAQNVQVPATVTNTLAMADSSIVMVPAMQRKERSSAVWALNVGEVRGQYFEGSVFERDYREVRPFEAYTVHRLENSQPAPRYIPIQEIGGTTGIDASLVNREEVNNEEWYDLEGRKLQGQPKQKGVYISKGKKVVVK